MSPKRRCVNGVEGGEGRKSQGKVVLFELQVKGAVR